MASVIIYNESTGQVQEYIKSANTPEYDQRSDTLINPNVSLLNSIDKKYIKVSGGVLVAMNKTEKDAVDTAEALVISNAESAKQLAFDNALDGSKTADATMTKVDARIDAISSFPELKAFLKILVRHTYKNNV